MQRPSQNFLFYGLAVHIESNSEELLARLKNDFSYYVDLADSSSAPFLDINAELKIIPADFLPQQRPKCKSKKVIYYDQRRIRFCDYHSLAVSRFDFASEQGHVISASIENLHEITYLMVLSRVGKKLDEMGLHRFHACGFSFGKHPILMTMPMGGGKSTLFMNMLRSYPDVQLLSDDSVLIDSHGNARSWALRVGLPSDFHIFYQGKTYELHRRFFGKKTLLPVAELKREVFKNDSSGRAVILFGSRTQGAMVPTAWPIGRLQALTLLIMPMVIGVGLPMIFEYFWESGRRDFVLKSKIALLRLRAAVRLAWLADNWRIELGTDRSANSHFIRQNFE